jgi:hypothetical protein
VPTELGPAYPADYTGLPTRMSGEDLLIWRRFQPRYQQQWLRLFFDVRLGEGRNNVTTDDDRMRDFWLRNTQKRADVIAETAESLWLIELRNAAQLNAVGRLLGYLQLWAQDPPIAKPVQAYLVTNSRDPDVEQLSRSQGIAYLVL